MKQIILVFLSGGVGSILRYLISKSINSNIIPYGTFLVNVIGCLIIGLVIGYTTKYNTLNSNISLLLATGFCGGFTTFSSFALENSIFIKSGDLIHATLYTFLSILVGFAFVFLGLFISKHTF